MPRPKNKEELIIAANTNYEFYFLSISTQFTFNVGWVDFSYSIPTK